MSIATALQTTINAEEYRSLAELMPALEEGFGAKYDDRHNYGDIIVYKATTRHGDYYYCWWGDDPEEMRQWSKLEHHFDRLSYRVESGWELVSRDEVARLQ